MSVIDILSSGNYIVVNKKIASELGLCEAILLGELAREHKYWSNTEKLEDGFFYSTVENIKENTTLSRKQQTRAMNTLEEKGIVTAVLKGIPAKRYVRINEDSILPYLLDKFVPNGLTSSSQTDELVSPKRTINNHNNNNNKQESKKESTADTTKSLLRLPTIISGILISNISKCGR